MTVLSGEAFGQCPAEYPDEVLFKVWSGTTVYCDCTKRWADKGKDKSDVKKFYFKPLKGKHVKERADMCPDNGNRKKPGPK